jgi:hypothetical protein
MGDIDSMSSTILHEIKNKKILDSKGIEGRKRVIEKFTYEIDANSFLRIYNRL